MRSARIVGRRIRGNTALDKHMITVNITVNISYPWSIPGSGKCVHSLPKDVTLPSVALVCFIPRLVSNWLYRFVAACDDVKKFVSLGPPDVSLASNESCLLCAIYCNFVRYVAIVKQAIAANFRFLFGLAIVFMNISLRL